MDQPLILYLHGFTSGPQSKKAQALARRMAERGLADRFLCPQLPASPAAAVALAEEILAKVGADGKRNVPPGADSSRKVGAGGTARVTLVGSSLGGFYATYLAERHGLRAVLVNPAVVAAIELERYLGPQTWLHSGESFEFTRAHIAELRALEVPKLADPSRYWLLVEEGDEVLDYRVAVARYAGARQTVLPGGDHGFTRWEAYLDEILAFAGLV
ncbi:YqiA/YcfP family alpha/beta fold hydrolase [Sulfuricystis thermophila]|uniref:YqiA/YcfP family alpha/beta fold hydrolase n=1 Tax=Sulfuricystis thermophila TaxID=2496847 RepID=UPI0024DF8E4F|nr:YqiA/YcfP family alpha/beta fold hydrolase [Sulfuricystis thermophila]